MRGLGKVQGRFREGSGKVQGRFRDGRPEPRTGAAPCEKRGTGALVTDVVTDVVTGVVTGVVTDVVTHLW